MRTTTKTTHIHKETWGLNADKRVDAIIAVVIVAILALLMVVGVLAHKANTEVTERHYHLETVEAN